MGEEVPALTWGRPEGTIVQVGAAAERRTQIWTFQFPETTIIPNPPPKGP